MASEKSNATQWMERIAGSGALAKIEAEIKKGGGFSASGAIGSSTTMVAGAFWMKLKSPVLLVTAHLDDADEACEELRGMGCEAVVLPAMEVAPGETSVSIDLLAARLGLVKRFSRREGEQCVIVAAIQSLMQAVPDAAKLDGMLKEFRAGDRIRQSELVKWLDDVGYKRVESLELPGEYAVRGGIVDVFPSGGTPARMDFFGDEIDSIHEIDLDSMGSDRKLERIELAGATVEAVRSDEGSVLMTQYLPAGCVGIISELLEVQEQGRSYYERVADARGIFATHAVFAGMQKHCAAVVDVNHYGAGAFPDRMLDVPVSALPTFAESTPEAFEDLTVLARQLEVFIACQSEGEVARTRELVGELVKDDTAKARIHCEHRYVHRGFVWDASATNGSFALVPHQELFHRYQVRRRVRSTGGGVNRALDNFIDLKPGDYVVHRDHGIARFAGLRAMSEKEGGGGDEFLTLEFAGGAKLHVPASKIELVQKYIGGFRGQPELSSLGGKRWKHQKEKVTEAVRDLAEDMLRLQAERDSRPGIRYPADTTWQKEFEAEFGYEETEDQVSAIAAVKADMGNVTPMDRLICGDVGFGKTEVAMRAAFKAVEFGKQVAVLVPTTVLAEQHERTFRERFADYPFRVESLSRFKTGKEQNTILEAVGQGQVDIVIGTHRLLSADVKFSDLGMVVIDEEQRFGVEHKQRLLSFRATADVLTLSATPIPRTLHMALLGLRDISSLTTPPVDRRAIVTEVISPDRRRIAQALQRELAREGQVYYVHNRVNDIQSVADDVLQMAPDARVIVGHGQMSARELEQVMLKFVRHQADILVSTTIIESGLDIPNANTMIVNNAHAFGLSELHQLRGRVGRSKHRAYCYLVLPKDRTISEVATKRLRALEAFSMLGAGFKIAL
ncbi:MAG TPA: DEAD/DEAH box helicase, partial [Phycisphaerales bacterium]|nr:DEAD/DEAH box helicase [Phycisphaerales bacterium]